MVNKQLVLKGYLRGHIPVSSSLELRVPAFTRHTHTQPPLPVRHIVRACVWRILRARGNCVCKKECRNADSPALGVLCICGYRSRTACGIAKTSEIALRARKPRRDPEKPHAWPNTAIAHGHRRQTPSMVSRPQRSRPQRARAAHRSRSRL